MSLQVCFCGWSKVTSYQGLRIHQGKKGCTPKGIRIPESERYKLNIYNPHLTFPTTPRKSDTEQYTWRNLDQKDNRPLTSAPVKKENAPVSPNVSTQVTPPSTKASQVYPAAVDVTVKKTSKPFCETPQHFQTTTKLDKARRALDFSTGAQQAQEMFDLFECHNGDQIQSHPLNHGARQDCKRAELQKKIQLREQQVDEVRISVKACKVSLDAEWLEINSVFSEAIKVVKDAWQKALQPLEERRHRVKREKQILVQKLKKEIDALKKSIDDLEKNPDLQVSLDESEDWKNVSVDTSFSFGTLRSTTSAMMEQIRLELEKLSSVELKRIPTFAVDVKLDPTTAHQCLVLSDDGKKVRDRGSNQKVPDSPQRFDMLGSVLGINSLTSGKSYWEVEVSNKTGWDLGVARGNSKRKGEFTLSPNNGYWVTVHYKDKLYAALTTPPMSLTLKEKPHKVGVFVDYEEGVVSFYDVTAQSHIYSFTECSFTGEIFPYFSPHLEQNGRNSDHLIISAVKKP